MKRPIEVIFILVMIAIIGLGMSPMAFGQEKAKQEVTSKEENEFTIARLVIGTEVENREPVGVAEIFPSSTEKVYCFLEATDVSKDTEVSFVWFYGEKEMSTFSLPLQMGSRWRTYAYKNLRGLKGDWRVEIRGADGSLLKDVKFKVE